MAHSAELSGNLYFQTLLPILGHSVKRSSHLQVLYHHTLELVLGDGGLTEGDGVQGGQPQSHSPALT